MAIFVARELGSTARASWALAPVVEHRHVGFLAGEHMGQPVLVLLGLVHRLLLAERCTSWEQTFADLNSLARSAGGTRE